MDKNIRGLDIERISQGFWQASIIKVRKLRAYVEKRKSEESVKMAPLYIDILYEIDKILEE